MRHNPLIPAILIVLLLVPVTASACATCGCGDPTLTLFGNEKPFDGRLRFSFDYRYRTEETGGTSLDRQKVREDRYTLGVAYAPVSRVFLGLSVPVLHKELTDPNLARHAGLGLGDVDATAKIFLIQGEGFSARHLLGLIGGVRLPTSRTQKDSAGVPLALEAQPGVGAWGGNFGAWYGFFRNPWSFYLTGSFLVLSNGRLSYDPGLTMLVSASGQYQILKPLAVQLALDTRWSARDYESGTAVPDTGGPILFVSPGIIWSPVEDLLVHAIVRLPAANGLNGHHKEGINVLGGITYDFETQTRTE